MTDKLEEKAKTIKISRDWSDSSMYFCSYGHLAQLVPELHAGSTMEVTLVRLEVAQQEIDKLKTFRDNAYKKWCDSQAELERERDSQKQKLKEKAIRLLQIRAGGRYRMFEAGMLYQCLVLLGMQEYTRHKQVDALVKITCHYFHESDAKKQLEELLK